MLGQQRKLFSLIVFGFPLISCTVYTSAGWTS